MPVYVLEIADFGHLGQLINQLEGREMPYDVKILHTTPNVFGRYFERGKYHIGRVFWETDCIPDDFAKGLHYVDEIWTGSVYNDQAIRKAGINKPTRIIPEAIDTSLDIDAIMPYKLDENPELAGKYTFYSIFEWTERKNPGALLQAYWTEFTERDNVALVLKTYVDNFTPEKRAEIKEYLRLIKKKLNLNYYAPVYLYTNLMDRNQIYRFHKTFDCFVSTHRGEGWGIPQMEAMLLGKPIISTNCGGIHEYLTDGKDAFLLPWQSVPLRNNNRNSQWYTENQQWAEVDPVAVETYMRTVYENQTDALKVGKMGRQTVLDKFSLQAVGHTMLRRLQELTQIEIPEFALQEGTAPWNCYTFLAMQF